MEVFIIQVVVAMEPIMVGVATSLDVAKAIADCHVTLDYTSWASKCWLYLNQGEQGKMYQKHSYKNRYDIWPSYLWSAASLSDELQKAINNPYGKPPDQEDCDER